MRSPFRWPATMNGPSEPRRRPAARILSALVLLLSMFSVLVMPAPVSAQALQPPTFSHQRGFYNSSFQLTLSGAPAGATIYYTLNGNSPVDFSTNELASDAIAYSGPIPINTTTVVRAAVVSGTTKSAVATHTYIFLSSVRNQPAAPKPGWPSIFSNPEQVTNPDDPLGPKVTNNYPADYEMDPEVLNHPNYDREGYRFEDVMKSLPTVSLVTDLPYLWDPTIGLIFNSNYKGSDPESAPRPFVNPVKPLDWERPMSLEWINPTARPASR